MRARTLAIAAVAELCACGGSPAPHHPDDDPNWGHVEPRTRDTPAPAVAWGTDHRFAWSSLPAVAKGAEVVAVPIVDSDGGRGNPNLRVELRDRSDKVVQTIAVATSDEMDKLAPGGTPSPQLVERLAAANRTLALLHGVHDFVAMHPLEVQPPTEGGDKHLAIGDGFDVDWNQNHLHVFRHNALRDFLTLDGTPWLAKPRTAAGEPCENPAYLAGAFHAAEINVIVVELAYKGSDTCWEPGNQLHVVTW
ncbi:MAG TPA: hypothetical protein VMJ10_03245 [Kofleriaceae bacterium]|nr:hypothetical protein [Kofleriaceae bacterium]